MFKKIAKTIFPKRLLNLRHLVFAWYGAKKFDHPSKKMHVIGITGTSGKSTTTYILRTILELAGHTVGSLSTIDFYIAGKEKLNDQKMTMLGKTANQRLLKEMVDANCDIAIVETTSEGVVQHRHKFIDYNTVALTNLYPEHIESHGSFENYKNEKVKLFKYAASRGKNRVAIVNRDVEQSDEFLSYNFSKKITFGLTPGNLHLANVKVNKKGLSFTIDNHEMYSPMYGEHNASNILAAVSIARSLNTSWSVILDAVSELQNPPGRIEFIAEAKQYGFDVIVDYAFEPVALEGLYKVVDMLEPRRIIHVCGATGGGRDKSRREPIGKIVGEKADIFIATDEDPYDEDPRVIIDSVVKGAKSAGMKPGEDLHIVVDREDAIKKAINMARKGDLILVTGKGSEQGMCVAHGNMISWDDRKIVKKAILDLPL
jgi:UDP-N-acetylmuramoyl-L-alanyl-D-glutamate--2,6-diaminopimelate ligase